MTETGNEAAAAGAVDPLVGTKVGNFRLVKQLGAGGMGVVYTAEHELMGKKAAVKLLLPELSSNKEIVGRFFNEAKAATKINHPGIVDVYDFGYHASGHAYIVMEFLNGQALTDLMKKGLHFGRIVDIAWQLSSALGAAHKRGIIHRDVKPDNVFIVPDPATPTGDRVKVLDFGIAKLSGDDGGGVSQTRTGTVMGTPVYMSPEQCKSSGEVDARSDIYAIGCIMFEMACGRPPFVRNGFGELIAAHIMEPPPRLSDLNPGVPGAYEAIVMRMLEKDAADRQQSTDEVEAELAAINTEALAGAMAAPAVGHAGGTGRSKLRTGAGTGIRRKPGETTFRMTSTEVDAEVPAPARKKWAIIGGAGAAVALGLVAVLALGGKKEVPAVAPPAAAVAAPAPAPAPVEAAAVKIEIVSTPEGASVVRAEDNALLGRTPYQGSFPRGPKELALIVRQDGFVDQRVAVSLLDSGKTEVRLKAEPVAAAAPAARPARAGKPAGGKPAGDGKGKKNKRDWGDLVDF